MGFPSARHPPLLTPSNLLLRYGSRLERLLLSKTIIPRDQSSMGRQQRQRPISCHFCRVRKLRCSRQFPCSNCTSRGVACQQGPDAAASSVTPVAQRRNYPSDVGTSEMLSRLEKLEALVASQGKELEMTRRPAYPGPRPSVAASSSSPMPTNLQRLTTEALWLEEMCAGQKSAVCT